MSRPDLLRNCAPSLPLIYNPKEPAFVPNLVVAVVVDHIEDLVEEADLLSRYMDGLLLHGNIDASLVDVQLAKHI